jgi:aspartate kinase
LAGSSEQGIPAVSIASTRMLLAHGFLAPVFEAFGRHQVVVDFVPTREVSISVIVDDTTRLSEGVAELESIGHIEVRQGLAVAAADRPTAR